MSERRVEPIVVAAGAALILVLAGAESFGPRGADTDKPFPDIVPAEIGARITKDEATLLSSKPDPGEEK